MSITTRDWTAHRDLMPGATPSFRVNATVSVAHPGITPRLRLISVKHIDKTDGAKACDLWLELTLESADGIFAQVVTDKVVTFTNTTHADATGVSIYHECKLLQQIDEVVETH
ncbi:MULTISPECIES: hypothetical protein [unclassified Pseudomonas]|uniref:hypothetical protein n=1 Tax=unclassified Pseudomonas TaxID=196821 RepID=UPI000BA33E62|nr:MULTISPECIES: hypothetical protein [unclassified Pseudomonas]